MDSYMRVKCICEISFMTICVLGVFLLNFFILILFQEYLKKKKQKPKELNEYTLQIGNYYLNIALIIL